MHPRGCRDFAAIDLRQEIAAPTKWPIRYVVANARHPPMRLRTTARPCGAPPSPADTAPVITKARSTATTVAGILHAAGGTKITISGKNAPMVNDSAEDRAACHGLLSSSGS